MWVACVCDREGGIGGCVGVGVCVCCGGGGRLNVSFIQPDNLYKISC